MGRPTVQGAGGAIESHLTDRIKLQLLIGKDVGSDCRVTNDGEDENYE